MTNVWARRVAWRKVADKINETFVKNTPSTRLAVIFLQRVDKCSDSSPVFNFFGVETCICEIPVDCVFVFVAGIFLCKGKEGRSTCPTHPVMSVTTGRWNARPQTRRFLRASMAPT